VITTEELEKNDKILKSLKDIFQQITGCKIEKDDECVLNWYKRHRTFCDHCLHELTQDEISKHDESDIITVIDTPRIPSRQ
jgi:hypothetical protein